MEWIDFKAIKAAVSIEAVLGRYNVQIRRVNQSSLRGVCPLPSHTSKRAPSFCVNVEKGAWSCKSQSCIAARGGKSGGNVLDFVAAMERCSIRDAAIVLARWFSVPNGHRAAPPMPLEHPKPQLVAERKREAQLPPPTPDDGDNKPLSFVLKNIDHAHPYLAERGIPEDVAAHFGIGYFPGRGSMSGRVVIPIHNERSDLVAYAGRAIDDSEPRYRVPANFHKSRELYNLHRAIEIGSDCVIVVEGFFGAVRVHQTGYPNVVALMGSSSSAEQELKLATHFARAVLVLDGDEAGRGATPEISARLMRRMFVKVIDLPRDSQPDGLPPEDLRNLIGTV